MKLGIPFFNPEFRPWTPAEDQMLGTLPDAEVAEKSKRSLIAVKKRHLRLGIPDPSPKYWLWTNEEINLLGTLSDAKLAEEMGCPVLIVTFKRRSLNISAYSGPKLSRVSWTPDQLCLLGTMPDTVVVARLSWFISITLRVWRESRAAFPASSNPGSHWPIPFYGNPVTGTVATVGVSPSCGEFRSDRNWDTGRSATNWKKWLENYFSQFTPPHE